MEKSLNKKIVLFIIIIITAVIAASLILIVFIYDYDKYWKEEKVPIESSKDKNIQLERKFEPKPIEIGTEEKGQEYKWKERLRD